MGPGVEYILRARDLLSGVLRNASKAAENASRGIDGLNKTTEITMVQAEKSVNRVSRSWSNYIEKVRDSNTQTNDLASGIRNVVSAVVLFEGIKSIVKMGADLEQSKISFDVLLGSADKARIMLAGLNKFANETPYENKPLIDQAKLLLSFGTSAEKILPILKMLGDVGMGDTNKMNSLTLAYAQISSAGKMQGQDLLQMVSSGFNPLQELTKMSGKSMATLRKEMEGGKISAEMVEAAFQHATSKGGLFFGMMDKMSQTASGKFSTLVGTLKQTGAEIGLKLLPYANELMNFLMPLVDWISLNADMLLQLTGVALGAFAAFKLITWGIQLWTIAQAILNGTMMLNPVGLIVIGIAALIAIIVVAWNKFAGFRGVVTGLWDTFKLFVNFLKDAVMNTVNGLVDMFVGLGKIINGIFSRDWGSVKEGASQVAKGYVNSFAGGGVVKAAIDNGSKIGETWSKGYKKGITSFAKSQADKKSGVDASSMVGGLAGGGGNGSLNTDDKIKSIAGGGSKPTNIYVNLNKEMIGQFTIHTTNLKEGAEEMKSMVMEVMSQVLNSANRLAHE
ncbi:MAG TPA: tape measure protein [Paludibacter sp.]